MMMRTRPVVLQFDDVEESKTNIGKKERRSKHRQVFRPENNFFPQPPSLTIFFRSLCFSLSLFHC